MEAVIASGRYCVIDVVEFDTTFEQEGK